MLVCAGWLAVALWPVTSAAGSRPKVAVMDLQAQGVPDETAATLTGILLAGLSEGGGIDMLGKSDLGKILSLDETKMLVGCPPNDPRCVVQHGQALGNAILVWGTVGRVGDQAVISVAAVDIKAGTTLGRESRSVDADDGAEMIDATSEIASKIRAALGLQSRSTWKPIMAASVRVGGNFSGYLGEETNLDTWLTSIEVEADIYILEQMPIFIQVGLTVGQGSEDNSRGTYYAYFVPAVVGLKYRWIREWLTPYAGAGVGLGFLDLANKGLVLTVQLLAGMEIARPNWKRLAFCLEGGFILNRPIKSKDLTQLGGRVNVGVIYRF